MYVFIYQSIYRVFELALLFIVFSVACKSRWNCVLRTYTQYECTLQCVLSHPAMVSLSRISNPIQSSENFRARFPGYPVSIYLFIFLSISCLFFLPGNKAPILIDRFVHRAIAFLVSFLRPMLKGLISNNHQSFSCLRYIILKMQTCSLLNMKHLLYWMRGHCFSRTLPCLQYSLTSLVHHTCIKDHHLEVLWTCHNLLALLDDAGLRLSKIEGRTEREREREREIDR